MANKVTDVVLKELYPKVEKSMKVNLNKWKKLMSNFFQDRADALYDIAPIDRIYFNQADENNLFTTLNISKQEVTEILQKTYYYDEIKNKFDILVKDEHAILSLTIIRYFIMKNDKKNTELSTLYLSFTGKIYASAHYRSFNYIPTRHVMEYAINNMSNKYDIVREGSVIGAVRSLNGTFIYSYKDRFKKYDDEDVSYLIQQLKNRIASFIKNIATEYYAANENKDYITYDSDNLSDDDYHLADSDSLKLEKIINTSIHKLETSTTDFRLCKIACAKDNNIGTDELRSIIDSIMTKPENFPLVKELIRNICTLYFNNSKKKDVRDIDFLVFSLAPKPNSKEKLYLRNKEILETLLLANSVKYKTRSKRVATKISYNTVLLTYFVWFIHEANK